jgi:hypothetical protein
MLLLNNQGLIEPEEERHEWVFHVMVSDRYEGWRESNVLSAQQEPSAQPSVEPTELPQPVSMIVQEP